MEHTTVLIGNQGECMKVSEKRRELEEEKMELEKKLEFKTLKQEERDKQIEEDYARLQRRKILERSGNCESLTLKYNPNTTYMG